MMGKTFLWMGAAFGIALAIAVAVLAVCGTDNAGIRLALELTARWSFLLFWLAYAGNAVAVLFGPGALAGHGREFGLAFASAHLGHIGPGIWLYKISVKAPLGQGMFLFFSIGFVSA